MVDEIPLRAHARPLGEPNPTETPEFHFTPAPRPTGRGRFRARIRFEQHPQQGWHVQLTVNNDGRGKRTARPRVIGTRSRLRRTYRSGRILSACQALSARPGCSSFEWLQPPLFTPRSFRDPEAKPSPARNADREVRRGSPRPLGCGFASRASGTPTGRVATPSGRTDGPPGFPVHPGDRFAPDGPPGGSSPPAGSPAFSPSAHASWGVVSTRPRADLRAQ
jgi:hypothetical protein